MVCRFVMISSKVRGRVKGFSIAPALVLCCGVVCTPVSSFASDAVIWQRPFDDGNTWTNFVKLGSVRVEQSADTLTVTGLNAKEEDTAWQITTPMQQIAVRGKYALCCSLASKGVQSAIVGSDEDWDMAIFWYDKVGRTLARHSLAFVFTDGAAYYYRFVDVVPAGAKQFQIKLGCDRPDLWKGMYVRFSNLRLVHAAADEAIGSTRPDIIPPRIRIVSDTPTSNRRANVVLSVNDSSGIDADSIVVSVDGKPRSDFVRKAVPDGFLVEIAPEGTGWSEGLHHVDLKASDRCGCVNDAKKVFLIGKKPSTPPVTLRDDGMTQIGGAPFFPIGVYAVSKRDFNAYDYDRAMSDLKMAGFNMVHSYSKPRDPGFLESAAKYGMKIWMAAYKPDDGIVSQFRHNPSIIAWYLGDDTSRNTSIETLHDRDDNMRAVDPTRLTTQAEELFTFSTPDAYYHYVPATDNFMPEVYPVRGRSAVRDRRCVAQVAREMDMIAEDQRCNGGSRRHSTWPIIQNFRGWGWNRFPMRDEFYGMCFAAVIHGAQGLTVYTYGGFSDPDKNKIQCGITFSEESWSATTNATRRLAELLPVLVERSPTQPPTPTILSGPERDAVGGASVTVLKKVKDGCTYLLAVNTADAEVKAKLSIGVDGKVSVLWEDRDVQADRQGAFVDIFKPLDVHVYCTRKLNQLTSDKRR